MPLNIPVRHTGKGHCAPSRIVLELSNIDTNENAALKTVIFVFFPGDLDCQKLGHRNFMRLLSSI